MTPLDSIQKSFLRVHYTRLLYVLRWTSEVQKFVSAEALARIRAKDDGIVPPGLFIPVAEETGLISRLGEIVFEKTCQFIKDCQLEQYGLKYIEVNLSVVQCEDKLLAKKVY